MAAFASGPVEIPYLRLRLVEIHGQKASLPVACLDLMRPRPRPHGQPASEADATSPAAILRMPPMATADPEWQDIVVLSGLVAMQQEVCDQQQQIGWCRPPDFLPGWCTPLGHELAAASSQQLDKYMKKYAARRLSRN